MPNSPIDGRSVPPIPGSFIVACLFVMLALGLLAMRSGAIEALNESGLLLQ